MSKSADKSQEFQALIGLVAFTSLLIGPDDPKVPVYCRAAADAWTTFIMQGPQPAEEQLRKLDSETRQFIKGATAVAIQLGYKMLDAAEEIREMAAQYEAEQKEAVA